MTSFKQFEAIQHNEPKSHHPEADRDKRGSERKGFRHGLVAETVVEILEDIEDYKAFEATIIADYDARTAVERELVLRLASLLWRIRRATAIETDLLRIHTEILRDRQHASAPSPSFESMPLHIVFEPINSSGRPGNGHDQRRGAEDRNHEGNAAQASINRSRALTHSFLRLVNLHTNAFEHLGRYEAALWRQIAQTFFALEPVRRRQSRFG